MLKFDYKFLYCSGASIKGVFRTLESLLNYREYYDEQVVSFTAHSFESFEL